MKRIIMIGLLIGAVLLAGCSSNKVNYNEFAKCLAANDVVFYGAFWCPHCARVKKAFGKDAWQYVNYVECDPRGENGQPELCQSKGIDGYMTAIHNDSKNKDEWLVGEPSMYELSKMSGCELPAGG